MVELKAVNALDDVRRAQVHNYLRATGYKLGLLVELRPPPGSGIRTHCIDFLLFASCHSCDSWFTLLVKIKGTTKYTKYTKMEQRPKFCLLGENCGGTQSELRPPPEMEYERIVY